MEMERYIIGKQAYPHGKSWTFQCPTCAKFFTYDQPGEPMCTGPSESRDDHDQILMLLVSVQPVNREEVLVPSESAIKRAEGPLFIPHGDEA
jgi:hypothetical protein